MSDEITTSQARQVLTQYFEVMFRNPSWEVIPDLIRDMHEDYQLGVYPWTEVEEYMADLWTRAEITFKDKS